MRFKADLSQSPPPGGASDDHDDCIPGNAKPY